MSTISFKSEIQACLQTLHAEGLLLLPTDTVWGISCDATSPNAIEQVYALKERPGSKALIILVQNLEMMTQYASQLTPALLELIAQPTNRPTTYIVKAADHLPEVLKADDGTIAMRIPQEPFCQALLTSFQRPLVSTSANLSGHSFGGSFRDIDPQICNGVDYIVKYRQEEVIEVSPSRILKVLETGKVQIIRP